MKRRTFLIASGGAVLSSSTLSVSDVPAVGVEFELSTVPDRDPRNIDSVLFDFSKFELTPNYIDYSEPMNISIDVSIDGQSGSISDKVSATEGEVLNREKISSGLPILLEGIDTEQKSIDGSILIEVSHPSIGTETYSQSFSITDNPVVNGLVSYYPISNNGSTIIHDAVKNRIGQISGASWSTDTTVGSYSLKFQDGDDIRIPNPVDPTVNNDNFTISFWAKPKSGEGSAAILEWSQNTDPDLHIWQYDSQDDFYINPLGTSGNIGENNGEIALDQWSHYTTLYDDADGEYRLYRDGNLVDRSSQPDVTADMSSDVLLIGTRINDDRNYVGYLNSIRVYDRTLSKSEIESLASLSNPSGNNIKDSDVPNNDDGGLARYRLDNNGSTETIPDYWNNNDGTDNTSAGYVNGVLGRSKNFDGNGDYIDLPTITGELRTISFWMKPDRRYTGDDTREMVFCENDGSGQGAIALGKYTGSVSGETFGIKSPGSDTYTYIDRTIEGSRWYHAAFVWEGDQYGIYLNGERQTTKEDREIGADLLKDKNFLVGIRADNTEEYSGLLDDIRFYNESLTSNEIERLFKLGSYNI